MIRINVAQEYSKTPGGRFASEGDYSGEDFREKVLKPRYLEAIEKKESLLVDLDGGYGYGSSFLEEAFGGLVRQLKNVEIDTIEIKSDEEPQLVSDVNQYMQNACNNKESR